MMIFNVEESDTSYDTNRIILLNLQNGNDLSENKDGNLLVNLGSSRLLVIPKILNGLLVSER